MRTTLTLDDDLGAKLEALARQKRSSFKDVVNETLRRGLEQKPIPEPPFVLKARSLGVRPGIQLDNIGELLEHLDGATHR